LAARGSAKIEIERLGEAVTAPVEMNFAAGTRTGTGEQIDEELCLLVWEEAKLALALAGSYPPATGGSTGRRLWFAKLVWAGATLCGSIVCLSCTLQLRIAGVSLIKFFDY